MKMINCTLTQNHNHLHCDIVFKRVFQICGGSFVPQVAVVLPRRSVVLCRNKR